MIQPERSGAVRLSVAQAEIRALTQGHAVTAIRRGTLQVKLSMPVLPNEQPPHTQDEIYVIVKGFGVLVYDGGERQPFEPGDLLFVAAGVPHYFTEFGDDLTVWVIFYGAEGGESTG